MARREGSYIDLGGIWPRIGLTGPVVELECFVLVLLYSFLLLFSENTEKCTKYGAIVAERVVQAARRVLGCLSDKGPRRVGRILYKCVEERTLDELRPSRGQIYEEMRACGLRLTGQSL